MLNDKEGSTGPLKAAPARYQVWARYRTNPTSHKIGPPVTEELASNFLDDLAASGKPPGATVWIERVDDGDGGSSGWVDEIENYLRAPARASQPGDRICAGLRGKQGSPRPASRFLDWFLCEMDPSFDWVLFCAGLSIGAFAALILVDYFTEL